MIRVLRALVASSVVLLGVLSACSSRDVVVFEVERKDDLQAPDAGTDAAPLDASMDAAPMDASQDTTPMDASQDVVQPDTGSTDAGDAEAPIVCNDLFDCPPYGYFCLKERCSDPTGTCEPRPLRCLENLDPVCGCNGVTYWNDCLRQQLGSAASAPGECQATAVSCARGPDCGFYGAACARLLFPDQVCPVPGSEPGPGTCWAIPPDCNTVPDEQRWRHCLFPDETEIPPCVNTCWAIRSEWVHLQAQVDTCD